VALMDPHPVLRACENGGGARRRVNSPRDLAGKPEEKFQPHESNLFGPRLQGAVKLSVPLDQAARREDARSEEAMVRSA